MVIAMKEFLDIVNEKGEPTGRLLPGTRLTIMEELLMVRDTVMDS
jgi:hypothetical protein